VYAFNLKYERRTLQESRVLSQVDNGVFVGYSTKRFDWVWGKPKYLKSRSFSRVVDFGCGSIPRNPLESEQVIGADLAKNSPFMTSESVQYVQIIPGEELPWEDNSLDAITGFDVIEHLPRQGSGSQGNAFIEMMNEFYRVLKPGGILLTVTPCYPSPAAFTDPTHVNIITPGTHKYFSDENFAKSLSYGFIGNFKTLSACWYPWAGSWILDSTLTSKKIMPFRSTFFNSLIRILRMTNFLRIRQLAVFALFRIARTHYLWVLEKA